MAETEMIMMTGDGGGGSLIPLTVQSLIESGCLSRSALLFERELPVAASGITAPPRRGDDDDGDDDDDESDERERDESPLRILNAAKLSLMLTGAFARCHRRLKIDRDLSLSRLDDFVVRLRLQYYSPDVGEEGDAEASGAAGDDDVLGVSISTADQFNANFIASYASNVRHRWILLDVDVKYLDARWPSAKASVASLMPNLGRLLRAIFSRSDAPPPPPPPPESRDSNGDEGGGRRIGSAFASRASKARRDANESETRFRHLIESGHPASVSRLLSDLADGSVASFDDVIHDLERMSSHPHVFLHDPEDGFGASNNIQFGQRFYGRSRELAKILEITTVPDESRIGLEAIFISGMAGSGKSHLVSAVGSFVSSFGFMVLTAKFKRGMEYESRQIVSKLIGDMLSNIAEMENGDDESDVSYGRRVARAISDEFDAGCLSALADFVPSVRSLIPEAAEGENNPECTHWQLIFLLSKLFSSVLRQERRIFLALDDLQWMDVTTLGLIREVLVSISKHPEERERLVFVGMYRDDEVSPDLMSFAKSLEKIEGGGRVNVTDMTLSTLTVVDVSEMITSELRLPRRLVSELADVVHKRTQGHAIFVVQLLNTLVSDSTIAYSPLLRRFCWDRDKVRTLKMADSVADLIVSNLTLLSARELQCLRIVSCFGMKVRSDLLELLDGLAIAPPGGFKPYLRVLVDRGILEIASPMVAFTHDLIQEQVYEGIPAKDRQQLHFDIGKFLGSKTSLDVGCQNKPLDAAIDRLYVRDASDDKGGFVDGSSLASFATSQMNSAGPDFFLHRAQRRRFASWNLSAGKVAAKRSNFRAALYYYKNGISFLGDEVWIEEDAYELCLKLHEGAAYSSSALGESDQISTYAKSIIDNANFIDSLVAEHLLIGSLSATGRLNEATARGFAALGKLNFDIPDTPSPVLVAQMMERVEKEAFMHNFSQFANQQKRVDSKTKNILLLVDAISSACWQIASPFLPLVAAVTVRYSLQNGICEESASAFVIFAYFQVYLKRSFESGRRWGNIVKSMLKNASAEDPAASKARFLLYLFLNFWYVPLQESISHMQDVEYTSLKCGDPERACLTQCVRFSFLFFRGENLPILSHEVGMALRSMARFSIVSAKFCALKKEMFDSLIGEKSSNPYAIFEGEICDKESLLADSQSKMHSQIAEAVHIYNFYLSFWMGDYAEAAKASDIATSFPSAEMPKVRLMYNIFYRGIVAFDLYRNGKGEKWLLEGSRMLDQVEIWVRNSNPILENKLALLKAERYASMHNVVEAIESYESSIKIARDKGYIHEQGLAYECMGKYLMSAVEAEDAERCFARAHVCYTQWGAKAKANKLRDDWNLGSGAASGRASTTAKRNRDE